MHSWGKKTGFRNFLRNGPSFRAGAERATEGRAKKGKKRLLREEAGEFQFRLKRLIGKKIARSLWRKTHAKLVEERKKNNEGGGEKKKKKEAHT